MRGQARLMENVFIVIIFIILASIFLILIIAQSAHTSRQDALREAFERTRLIALRAASTPALQCHLERGVETACLDLIQADVFPRLATGDYREDAYSLFRRSRIILTPFHVQEGGGTTPDAYAYYGLGRPSEEADYTASLTSPTLRKVRLVPLREVTVYDALPARARGRIAFTYPIRAYDPVQDVMSPAFLTVVMPS